MRALCGSADGATLGPTATPCSVRAASGPIPSMGRVRRDSGRCSMRPRSSALALAVAALLALVLAALPAAATPTPQRTTIRVGSPQKVSSQWPFWMAMQRGTFTAMNLDVDFDVTRTEPLTAQYLASNSIDVAITTPAISFTAVEAGARIAIIGGLQNRMTYYLVGRPDVRTLADLRGRSVGVDQVRGALPAIAKALIAPS